MDILELFLRSSCFSNSKSQEIGHHCEKFLRSAPDTHAACEQHSARNDGNNDKDTHVIVEMKALVGIPTCFITFTR